MDHGDVVVAFMAIIMFVPMLRYLSLGDRDPKLLLSATQLLLIVGGVVGITNPFIGKASLTD